MKRLTSLLCSLALTAMVLIFPAGVAADTRCNGAPGIQYWENINKGGSTNTTCAVLGTIYIPQLSQVTNGLFWLANWNDRISSYEVFNMPATKGVRLFDKENFQLNISNPDGFYMTTMGNGYVSDLRSFWNGNPGLLGGMNDHVSSMKTVGF